VSVGYGVMYIEAPREYDGDKPSLFLAGGITDCPDWQAEARHLLADAPIAVLNPRRAAFPIDDPSAAAGQVSWEFRHLRTADMVLFWFPAGRAVQPISLYELGAHAAAGKPIAVGADLAYPRRPDVVMQLGHVRPEVTVVDSLAETCRLARLWLIGPQVSGGRARDRAPVLHGGRPGAAER
jgi:hypothetical protein